MTSQYNIKKLTRKLLRKDIKNIVTLSNMEKEELKIRILFAIKQQAVIK